MGTSSRATVAFLILAAGCGDNGEENSAPVLPDRSLAVAEDAALAITLAARDADDDVLTYTLGEPAHGVVTGTGSTRSYQPDLNFHGEDAFDIVVADGTHTITATFRITVAPVDDAPVMTTGPMTESIAEDGTLSVELAASDIDSAVRFAVIGRAAHGTASISGTAATYTPDLNYSGVDSFTVAALDDSTTSPPITITVMVGDTVECGDGLVEEPEECDDANLDDGDACIECVAAVCGDNVVQIGVEGCDDGNAVDDDACDNACAQRCDEGCLLGTTIYQFQTNRSIGNRLINNENGTRSAVWTMSTAAGWTDRGTGYNHYDGLSWRAAPTTRPESVRTGWPNIAATADGRESILGHTGASVHLLDRPELGSGSWRERDIAGPAETWPRLVAGGEDGNTLHALSLVPPAADNDVGAPLSYHRSTDGGDTWTTVDLGAQLGPHFADEYAIDARGRHVAIVAGGRTKDVVLLTSEDDGETWERTVVHAFAIANYDPSVDDTDLDDDNVGDPVESNDGALAVLIGNGDTPDVHVWFGLQDVIEEPGEGGYGYFLSPEYGLMYWRRSASASAVPIATYQDLNNDDTLTLAPQFNWSYGVGATTHPSAGIAENGDLYLAYGSVYEGASSQEGYNYRHTYITRSLDGGDTWCAGRDVTPDQPIEAVYGAVARRVDGFLHLLVQEDEAIGHGVSDAAYPQGDPAEVRYYSIPIESVCE